MTTENKVDVGKVGRTTKQLAESMTEAYCNIMRDPFRAVLVAYDEGAEAERVRVFKEIQDKKVSLQGEGAEGMLQFIYWINEKCEKELKEVKK